MVALYLEVQFILLYQIMSVNYHFVPYFLETPRSCLFAWLVSPPSHTMSGGAALAPAEGAIVVPEDDPGSVSESDGEEIGSALLADPSGDEDEEQDDDSSAVGALRSVDEVAVSRRPTNLWTLIPWWLNVPSGQGPEYIPYFIRKCFMHCDALPMHCNALQCTAMQPCIDNASQCIAVLTVH